MARVGRDTQAAVSGSRIDFHGHGEQPAWSGDAALTLADDAALARPVLAELGGAHVIGHSYGGAVALKLAASCPEQVRSVVAYEPVLFHWLMDHILSSRRCRSLLRSAKQSVKVSTAAMRIWPPSGSSNSGPVRMGVDIIAPAKQDAIAARMRAVLNHFDALAAEPLALLQLRRCRCR